MTKSRSGAAQAKKPAATRRGIERGDALPVEPELAKLESAIDLRHDLQLLVFAADVGIGRPVDLNEVPAPVLGLVAAGVGGRQHLVGVAARRVEILN